jgi:diguanylate cyclase (GGDEF)-like protein/PAS domain S-box-containing protein
MQVLPTVTDPKETRVLIVDDDPLLRRLCVTALRNSGMDLQEAGSGEQAVQCFASSRTDLVILDVQMDGIDGYETCRRIRRLPGGGNVPVIMLTSLDDADSIERAYESGATDFIAKPFQWPLLTQRVRYALRAAATAEVSRQVAASLARAQEMAQLGSWSVSLDGSVYCSDEFLRLLGLDAGAISGTTCDTLLDMVVEADRVRLQQARQVLAAHGRGYEAVYVVRRADGVLRTVYEQASPQRDSRGDLLGMECITQDITDRAEAERQIQQLASHDALTGLPNRDYLQKLVAAGLEQARERGLPCALLHLDIDRFKAVNNALGAAAGDLVLKTVAERLSAVLGCTTAGVTSRGDVIGRVGGNAFVVFLARAADAEAAGAVAQRLRTAVAESISVAGRDILLTARLGIALHPRDAGDSHALLRYAEQALHVAKHDQDGSILFYDVSISAEASSQLVAETDLRRALAGDELRVFLQPKFDAQAGKVVGAEALVRWQHPDRGLVSPAEFIPLAEKTGLIGQLTEWMLEQVCRLAAGWKRSGLEPVPVSVNIPASSFISCALVERIDQLLRSYQLSPRSLVLEVTESLLVREVEKCIARMHELRQRGIAISLDDFGTGYSSLSYLKVMPLDELKLDRSFVTDIGVAGRNQALIAAVIALAQTLDLTVVAEGVETQAQAQVLSGMGCRIHQGYLYGRPMPAAAFPSLLAPCMQAIAARTA